MVRTNTMKSFKGEFNFILLLDGCFYRLNFLLLEYATIKSVLQKGIVGNSSLAQFFAPRDSVRAFRHSDRDRYIFLGSGEQLC